MNPLVHPSGICDGCGAKLWTEDHKHKPCFCWMRRPLDTPDIMREGNTTREGDFNREADMSREGDYNRDYPED